MRHIRNSILKHVRFSYYKPPCSFIDFGKSQTTRHLCASPNLSHANLTMDRILGLVKKFCKTDANKVTETADFQKDLCLDSLDKVELVMVLEQEFSIEIPDEIADKLACCADVAKYIMSESECKNPDSASLVQLWNSMELGGEVHNEVSKLVRRLPSHTNPLSFAFSFSAHNSYLRTFTNFVRFFCQMELRDNTLL